MLAEEEGTEDLYLFFAEFEEFCREFERARAIYKYALDHVPKGRADALYARFVTFEKQHGDRESIEEVLSAKKRLQVRSATPCRELRPHVRAWAPQWTRGQVHVCMHLEA